MSSDTRTRWTNTGLIAPGANSVRVLRESDMGIAFQPIVDLKTGRTFAHEALARCRVPAFQSPAALFERAATEEACGRLGRIIRNVLFEACPGLPVFVNIHPQEVGQRWLVQPTDPLFVHDTQVYLEVTESAAFEYFDLCMSVLHEVRSRSGARIVVDDFGAGYSDLDRVLALEPDVVKLDMSLIRNLDQDAARQAHVGHLIETCHRLNARVVCEGIESLAELACVMELGSDYAQGYLLGRPTFPPTDANWPFSAVSTETDGTTVGTAIQAPALTESVRGQSLGGQPFGNQPFGNQPFGNQSSSGQSFRARDLVRGVGNPAFSGQNYVAQTPSLQPSSGKQPSLRRGQDPVSHAPSSGKQPSDPSGKQPSKR